MVECVVTGLSDEYPKILRKYKEWFILAMSVSCYLIGLAFVTRVRFLKICVLLHWGGVTQKRTFKINSRASSDGFSISSSGADWPVGLLGWGPKGPPQQGFPWAPSVLEEKCFKWLIFDELYDSDKTTCFNQ